MPRLTAAMRIGAIRRFAEQRGGFATVLKSGDDTSGDILLVLTERGRNPELFSRQLGADGDYRWGMVLIKSEQDQAVNEYIARSRQRDPDLWVIELDVADKAQLIETLDAID